MCIIYEIRKHFFVLPQDRPFVMSKADGGFEGFIVDVVKEVAQIVGFQYELKFVPDGRYGSPYNGSWNGMVGQLDNKVSAYLFPLLSPSAQISLVRPSIPYLHSL